MKNRICELFGIEYPIIQAGMIWISGGKLAGAAAEAGALGIIGAGSMAPDLLRQHIQKAKQITNKPLAVNVPLLYHKSQEQIDAALEEGIRIFFTSAGSPKKLTPYLKEKACTVVHVTSSPELAMKCEAAGVDAIVAEGFEAGGHNGRDEITSLVLIPQVVDAVNIPVIAAGGVGDGRAMAAMFALGADAVQIGTRFVATQESSAHDNFRNAIVEAGSADTMLSLKELVPVRLLKNKFYDEVRELESKGTNKDALSELLGKGRSKAGMLDGKMDEGELEIGQVAAMVKDIPTCAQLVQRIMKEYDATIAKFRND